MDKNYYLQFLSAHNEGLIEKKEKYCTTEDRGWNSIILLGKYNKLSNNEINIEYFTTNYIIILHYFIPYIKLL